MKKVSINDIAKEVCVSKTLVSFVLNGRGKEKGISPVTEKKVLLAAKKFNYKPNHFARGLRLGKTQTIGLIVADISNKFYAKIASQIEKVASQNNYNLIISSSDENPEKELALINMLRDRQVDGLIISTTQKSTTIFSQLTKEKYPFVLIDRNIPSVKSNFVGCENYKGAFEATTHMINNGYEKIALLKISPEHISTIKDRELGFRSALKSNGLRTNNKLIRTIDVKNIKTSVREVLQQIMLSPLSTDAIFSLNNNITVACLEYFNEVKLRIPEDVALISFDDIEMFRFSNPAITSVSQPVEAIGESAVKLLLNELNELNQDKTQVVFPVELIKRRSSGLILNQIHEIN